MRPIPLIFVSTAMLSLVFTTGCQFSSEHECAESESHGRDGIRSYIGSTLKDSGVLSAGADSNCYDDERIRLELDSLHTALAMVPSALHPGTVTVHHRVRTETGVAPIRGAEVHVATNSIMTSRTVVQSAAIWLHELAHLKVQSRQPPSERTTRRLFDAIQEAAADYYAAAILRNSKLNSRAGETFRDIETAPRPGARDWANLALQSTFDAHSFGAPLASLLWKAEPKPEALLTDLLSALSNLPPGNQLRSPQGLVEALTRGCPQRSRKQLEKALKSWLPSPLLPKTDTLTQENL